MSFTDVFQPNLKSQQQSSFDSCKIYPISICSTHSFFERVLYFYTFASYTPFLSCYTRMLSSKLNELIKFPLCLNQICKTHHFLVQFILFLSRLTTQQRWILVGIRQVVARLVPKIHLVYTMVYCDI